jgi:hypothetical protein
VASVNPGAGNAGYQLWRLKYQETGRKNADSATMPFAA